MRTATAIGRIGMLAVLCAAGPAVAQTPSVTPVSAVVVTRAKTQIPVPIQDVAEQYRAKVAKIVQQPTLSARAAPEEFPAGIYAWLLDHPDRASLAWRRLGIPCSEITDRGQGQFGWSDGEGTEVTWRAVHRGDDLRVWYAEGHTRISPLMPKVPVQAVVLLRHQVRMDADGQPRVTHDADVYLQTDSRAAAAVARLLGPTAPRLAEQGAGQLLLFFSGLTRYFEKHPEDVAALLARRAAN